MSSIGNINKPNGEVFLIALKSMLDLLYSSSMVGTNLPLSIAISRNVAILKHKHFVS